MPTSHSDWSVCTVGGEQVGFNLFFTQLFLSLSVRINKCNTLNIFQETPSSIPQYTWDSPGVVDLWKKVSEMLSNILSEPISYISSQLASQLPAD